MRFQPAVLCLALLLIPCRAWSQLPPADFGDAPECFPPYFDGVLGHFPTCLLAPCAPGSQEAECGAMSTPPGPTGFIRHVPSQAGQLYWLGCHGTPDNPLGRDDDPDGRSPGDPGCAPPHCSEYGFYEQDECNGDGVDAGIEQYLMLLANCGFLSSFQFTTYCAGAGASVYLNVLVDMNQDGDWNDTFQWCTDCAREWAVKNAPLSLSPGCQAHDSPSFQAAPTRGQRTWIRVTLTDEAVDDDFPWRGSEGRIDSAYHGGETEDYPTEIVWVEPAFRASWGKLKIRYR